MIIRRVINSLKYGDARTKGFLIGILVSLLGALVSIVLCILVHPLIFGGTALICMIAAVLLFMNAGFSFEDINHEGEDEDKDTDKDKDTDIGIDAERKDSERHISDSKTEETSDTYDSTEEEELADNRKDVMKSVAFDEAAADDGKDVKKSAAFDRMVADSKKAADDAEGADDRIAVKDNIDRDSFEESESLYYYEQYNDKSLKKLFRTEHVKGEPIPILIDICESERIRQCPAYMWDSKKRACFMLLLKNPRTISYPLSEILTVTNRPGVQASPKLDYGGIAEMGERKDEFERLLPSVYSEGTKGRFVYRKNLYVLGEDIAITPMSLRGLMKKYDFTFDIKDRLLEDDSFSIYFKEAYKNKILWNDGVITAKEYQEKIKSNLLVMSMDKKLIDYDFEDYLTQMTHYRLITEEYAEYYRIRRAEKKNTK